jgi:hypothetical protein
MRVYFYESNSYGPAMRMFAVGAFMAFLGSVFFVLPVAELPAYYMKLIAGGLFLLYGVILVVNAIFHIRCPSLLFIEVTDTVIRWIDLAYFGVKENKVALEDIDFIGAHKGRDGNGDSVFLKHGGDVTLPRYLIGSRGDFTNALKKVAPHVVFSDEWEMGLK